MVHKITLLRDLPEMAAGYVFYVKGDKTAEDRNGAWYGASLTQKRIVEIRHKAEWVKDEPAPGVVDDRPHLSTLVGEPLMTLREALDALGWAYDWSEEGAVNIRCCGDVVALEGICGADRGYCRKDGCPKHMQDMRGMFWVGNASMNSIDSDKYQCDDGRAWLVRGVPEPAAQIA
jgi:hypothetical protein